MFTLTIFQKETLLTGVFLFFVHIAVFAQSKPVFSPNPGFYSHTTLVTLSASPGDVIYYTLDGSIPDESSYLYTGPIEVDDRSGDEPVITFRSDITHVYSPWVPPTGPVQLITVVRARSKSGEQWSNVSTGTYIVHPDGTERFSIPIVSLVTDPHNLFDYDYGIYVLGRKFDERPNPGATPGLGTQANYTMRGDEWERPASFELFEPDGSRPLAQDIGIRMHGGGSRSFQQKSFRLYSRSEYGTSRFRYQIFPEKELDNYNRLILRNSGQDWMKTMLRDGFMQNLVNHLPFETMAFRPALLFLNGEFWGIANIRERYDKHYLSIKYGISDSRIDYLTGNRGLVEGSAAHYNAMLNYITSGGVVQPQRFEYIKTQMDTESFMYYNLANIYFNNRDWPHNNIDFWRYQSPYNPAAGPGRDGRWRWMMFDTDFGFAWTDIHRESTYQLHVKQNYLEHASRPNQWSTTLLRELLRNNTFEADFINTYRDLRNSEFLTNRVIGVLDSLKSIIEPHVNEHITRWGNSDHRWSMPKSVSEWEVNLEYIRRFARERGGYVDEHFREKFNLGSLYAVNISVNDTTMGHVRIHRLDIRKGTIGVGNYQYPAGWTGRYFNGHPVTVQAIPRSGYRFKEWMNAQSDTDTFTVTGLSGRIVAIFEPESVSAEPPSDLPRELVVYPAYPNPFNPTTNLRYVIPEAGFKTVELIDMTGRVVLRLFEGQAARGEYAYPIDMTGFASGVYMIRLTIGGQSDIQKITLVK